MLDKGFNLTLRYLLPDIQDRLEMFSSEEDLENASLYEPLSYVGVVFLDKMSYQLRFPYNLVPLPSDFTESIGEAKTRTGLVDVVLKTSSASSSTFLVFLD